MTQIAVIDVGSNSIKVAVVDGKTQQEIGRSSESIRLFQPGDEAALLPSDIMDEAVEGIVRLLAFARGHGAERIVILGTSAVRDCKNREIYSHRIKAKTGLGLTIISGEVEARLTAAAIRSDVQYSDYKNILAFDLGGGSLEVMALREKQCTLARSFALGSVRLTHGYLRGGLGVVDEHDQSSIRSHLLNTLSTIIPSKAAENFLIIGAGGAFASIALYLSAIGEAPIGGRLPLLRIRELKDKLCALNIQERQSVPGLPKDRLDIMPAALVTLCTLADLTGAEAFHLTHRGVRHGMMELMLGPSGDQL